MVAASMRRRGKTLPRISVHWLPLARGLGRAIVSKEACTLIRISKFCWASTSYSLWRGSESSIHPCPSTTLVTFKSNHVQPKHTTLDQCVWLISFSNVVHESERCVEIKRFPTSLTGPHIDTLSMFFIHPYSAYVHISTAQSASLVLCSGLLLRIWSSRFFRVAQFLRV